MTRHSQLASQTARREAGRFVHFVILNFAFCICAGGAGAQAINHDETRLMGAPHGRPGCFAPLQVVFDAPQNAKSALVESISDGVVLTRQVNIDAPSPVATRVPWLVAKGSRVRVTINGQSDEFTPAMPTRPQPPSYGRAYVAVFATDAAKARELLPPSDDLACDFFPERDAPNDWRMLDGYDCLLFLGSGAAWPDAVIEAATHFASLGGCVIQDHGAVTGHGPIVAGRQGLGVGAVYTLANPALSDIRRAARHHRWRGDDLPPAGPAPSRAIAEPFERGWLIAQGQEPPRAPVLFFALAGLALIVTLLGPIVAARLTARAWVAPLAIVVLAGSLAALGLFQGAPPATVEYFTVDNAEGEIASRRTFITCEAIEGAPEAFTIRLDAGEPRILARGAPARVGCRAWVLDTPLTAPLAAAKAVEIRNGTIEGRIFRDYAAGARRGDTHFSDDQARILDWWLERHAYRGCDARLAPATAPPKPPAALDRVFWRPRGAITVTPLRK